MSKISCCSALVYRENGDLPLAQSLMRPASVLLGRSFDKVGDEFQPTVLQKIAAIAFIIIFLPVALPLIGIGFIALSLSSSHTRFSEALKFSGSSIVLSKDELKKIATESLLFVDQLEKLAENNKCVRDIVCRSKRAFEKSDHFSDLLNYIFALKYVSANKKACGVSDEKLEAYIKNLKKLFLLSYEQFQVTVKERIVSLKKDLSSFSEDVKNKIEAEIFNLSSFINFELEYSVIFYEMIQGVLESLNFIEHLTGAPEGTKKEG